MLIKVINPNTTLSMTEKIGDCARSVTSAGTVIDAVSPSMAPTSIESHYDEALAVPGLLEQIAIGERGGVDGYVIACFGDPGLDAARELASGSVVGIAEAAMHAATCPRRSGYRWWTGVAAATKTVESLVALGLSTSARSEYAAPGPKQYVGALRGFTV